MRRAIAWINILLMTLLAAAALLIAAGPSGAQPASTVAATIEEVDGSQSAGSDAQQIEVQIGATNSDSSSGSVSPAGGVDALTTAPPTHVVGGGLAFTGFAIMTACLLGFGLLVGGLTFVFLGRRHPAAH